MMDPHNPQMQYYNQQNDWTQPYTGKVLYPGHPAINPSLPGSLPYQLPNYSLVGKTTSRNYFEQGKYDQDQGRIEPTLDRTMNQNAHHMMQMAQVAQAAPRRGRKPLNEKKKRRKRNRPGSHIKRAKTAYFFFLDDFRKSYCKSGDQIPKVIKASEITKACGKQWGIMTDLDKKPYAEKAAEDRKRYESEISVYRKVRDPDKPKKPPTAYFYFLTDFRAQMAGQKIEKGRRLTEICGEEWNKLTEEQKKPYLDRVAIEYKKYQERMEEYRRKKGMAPPAHTKQRAQAAAMPTQVPLSYNGKQEGAGVVMPKGMASPPQTQMRLQPMPTQVPLSYNGKSAGAGVAMPVPQDDDEEDDDDLVDDEDEEDDDI